jgi:hypothetical protein
MDVESCHCVLVDLFEHPLGAVLRRVILSGSLASLNSCSTRLMSFHLFTLNCLVVISSRSCFFHVKCDSTVCLHGPVLTVSNIKSSGKDGSSPMSIIWKLSRATRDSLCGRVGLSSALCRDPMCSVSSLCSVLWCIGSFSTTFFVDCTFKRFRNAS